MRATVAPEVDRPAAPTPNDRAGSGQPAKSAVTERATALVAERRPKADALGRHLASLTEDPDAFASALRAGFLELADPDYRDHQPFIAPGIGPTFGVRWPLTAAVERGFREATRRERPSGFLEIADRLFRDPELEPRWLAFGLLDRLLPVDAERAWQLLRRAAREATDWITIDSLAHPVGRGILLEGYRWAELEQLVYSPSRWERRLVGSTIATLPFVDHRRGRTPDIVVHGLGLIGQLIGDASADVQRALSWALRSLVLVDRDGVSVFMTAEAERAAATGDGNRAWVLRDALSKLDSATAAPIRAGLAGLRRSSSAASTSAASSVAGWSGADAGPPDGHDLPEPMQ